MIVVLILILLVAGINPMLTTASVNSILITQTDEQAASHAREQSVLHVAIQTAVADLENRGGARLLQQDFAEAGLSVYILTAPEVIAGTDNAQVRIWATARPLTDSPTVSPDFSSNNTLVATAAYDQVAHLVSEVRFIDTPRSTP